MVEQAATRRGVRDAAIIAVLDQAGTRVEERARLNLDDVVITARTGSIRLYAATRERIRSPGSVSPPGS